MLTIRLDSPVPLVDQILQGIRQRIASGELPPGTVLPTVRQLAADLGVNFNTVARAYRALEDDGLVHTVRGRGTEVAARVEKARGTRAEMRARVAAGLGESLADARLAGMSRDAVTAIVNGLIEEFWGSAAEGG
jgi:GntR family transcriptional regulator